jgi:hypothetical protein
MRPHLFHAPRVIRSLEIAIVVSLMFLVGCSKSSPLFVRYTSEWGSHWPGSTPMRSTEGNVLVVVGFSTDSAPDDLESAKFYDKTGKVWNAVGTMGFVGQHGEYSAIASIPKDTKIAFVEFSSGKRIKIPEANWGKSEWDRR